MVWEGAEGVKSPVEEEVEGVVLSVGKGVGSWLSSSNFSFSLFMYVLCDFLPRSCLLGSFVTFSDVLSMFILRYKKKRVGTNTDPIFEHPVFDSAREKVKHVMRQLEKPQEALENSLYICFKCGSKKIFSIAKQVRSTDEGMTVFNECRDCRNKWRD